MSRRYEDDPPQREQIPCECLEDIAANESELVDCPRCKGWGLRLETDEEFYERLDGEEHHANLFHEARRRP